MWNSLLGKAISNTFDGDKILDETTILKGIHKRSDIGNKYFSSGLHSSAFVIVAKDRPEQSS